MIRSRCLRIWGGRLNATMVELSAELLESTLYGLRADKIHNRRHPRAPMRAKLTVYPITDRVLGKPREVWTRDLSTAGMGLLASEPFPLTSKFLVRLPRNEGAGFLHLLCTVRNCDQQAKDVYSIGASFVQVNSSSAISPEEEAKRISQAILG